MSGTKGKSGTYKRTPEMKTGKYKRTPEMMRTRTGENRSEITRERCVKGQNRRWSNPLSRKLAREFMIAHPNRIFKNTSIELKVETELIKREINYEKQTPLCKVAIVDFYLPEYRIVVQADGCYWHNCPLHGSGEVKNCTEKDERQDKVLAFNGFNVYRFWEHEINESVVKCLDRLNINNSRQN